MRLINVHTYQVEDFPDHDAPPYAILSHTWGSEEVILEDMQTDRWKSRPDKREGCEKIKGCCSAAADEGFDHVWIDTCCIDKTSSAELSLAINSMFRWYQDSMICFAYLNDVDSTQNPADEGSDFAKSRWFTRGWTLQELLAPAEVIFLGSDWSEIGTKWTLRAPITTITRISGDALADRNFSKFSVAQRMSWAANRQTTRLEDEAYSLFGLFDVNMPLLYGEGERAFVRLQEEIMKRTDDESIFAWSHPPNNQTHVQLTGLLAASPKLFRDSTNVVVKDFDTNRYGQLGTADPTERYVNPFEMVRQFIRVSLPLIGPLRGIEMKPTKGEIGHVLNAEPTVEREWDHRDGTTDSQDTEIIVPDLASLSMMATKPPLNSNGTTASGKSISGNPGEDDDDAPVTTEPSIWRWYIYEPVTIVPLMCSIDGKGLGIVLSRGSFRSWQEGILYRLHSPSLVCMGDLPPLDSSLSPRSRSTYVYATATYNNDVEKSQTVSSEIRVANVTNKCGYTVFQEPGSEWVLEPKSGKLLKTQEHHRSRNSMVVFHHLTGPVAEYPTFFLIPDFDEPYIGVLTGSAIPGLGQEVWRIAMKGQNRAEIALGKTRQSIVLKARKTTKLRYLNISIEPQNTELPGAPTFRVRSGLGRFNLRLQRIWSNYSLQITLNITPNNRI